MATSGLTKFEQDTAHLKETTWTDEELARIDTEELATEAFKLSEPLKREFGGWNGLGAFLAYWHALRKGLVNGFNR